jgi:TolB-like protein/Flp pilus assembly protein TadD
LDTNGKPDLASFGVFEFGRFRLDAKERLLLKNGQPVSLAPKAFDILRILLENHGRVVSKDDLLNQVWRDTFVEEANVAWNIHALRRALGETAKAKFISTVPKVGFRFVAEVTPVTAAAKTDSATPRVVPGNGSEAFPSVAVLPFRNLDRDPDGEYFGDGLTEEVINSLANLQGLRVAARTSSFAFKGKDIDIRQIGQALGVTAVLEGSVRRSTTHLRITAQLINVADGCHIWSQAYARKADDIFKIQEEISHAIVEHMLAGFRISPPGLAAKRTTHVEAYNAFLLGRYFWNKRNGDGVRKSIDYFNACLKADPSYAPAYAGLADSYTTLGLYRILPPHVAFAKAKWAATHALEYDQQLAEPHAALGMVHVWYDWNWYDGDQAFRRCIAMNPNYATAHQWYALALPVMGRVDEAVSEMEKASRLEPLSLPIRSTLAWTYYLARQYDRAAAQARETIELDPQFLLARFYLGLILCRKSQFTEAAEQLELVVEGTRGLPITVSALAATLAAGGQRRRALAELQRLRDSSRGDYVSPYDLALVHSALGQIDAAFECLEQAYEERGWLNHLQTEPMFDELHADPRCSALLKRMGCDQ